MAGTPVTSTRNSKPFQDSEAEHVVKQINNIVTDLETIRTTGASGTTLLEELHDDHATFKTVVDDLKTLANALRTLLNNGVLVQGTLLISATPEDFKTTTTAYFRIANAQYSKAATDSLSFSAADTINTGAAVGSFWGIWLVQIDAAGTISTKSPAADQVYVSEAAAIAALPAVDAGNVALGYITVNANDDVAWIANTDDLTPTSDCADANFTDATVLALPAAVTSSAPATLTATKPVATDVEAADLIASQLYRAEGTAIV